ncbi:hypothetical protein [Actinophytocola oryzae]|uniref:Uncharacterized protein n=1 Tax=Actinophytocola oryzae TaxID=502181 RepID=A0A4R7W3J6_9PSEU|nr:hypothetical protein [Actinophytocola oryzae]TDV57216.1 hypothetical protein CLV71_10187 [Actinophytocola oryzae]
MDVQTYATVTAVCARLAGRLSDETLGAVRGHFAGGEPELAESALLLGLAYEGVGVTREEHELIRSVLEDPDSSDLAAVRVVESEPAPAYRFGPSGPVGGPDPAAADRVLSAEVPRHGGRRLRRAWREPLPGAPEANGSGWVYVAQVESGTDELLAYSGLSSRLWVDLRSRWPVEVVVEGGPLPRYQAAVLTAAHEVWRA